MRKYVSLKILRSINFAIFDSYLSYCCLFWAQNRSTIQRRIFEVRIINFPPRNSHTSPLFKQNFILKFQDICLENILFASNLSLNNLTPSFFIHGLVFPQINITMKPQVLHRYFIKQKDAGSIQPL